MTTEIETRYQRIAREQRERQERRERQREIERKASSARIRKANSWARSRPSTIASGQGYDALDHDYSMNG